MRDKNRIKRIFKLIEKIWIKNLYQRFGQLLINLGIVTDDFNTWQNEDDILEKRLIKIKNG
ncbi:MAG: hypothetical protein KKF50_02970 [Nanoarchaeota archaeon]|nr:hypothetical protein [Nanoarchaeota archaeon]